MKLARFPFFAFAAVLSLSCGAAPAASLAAPPGNDAGGSGPQSSSAASGAPGAPASGSDVLARAEAVVVAADRSETDRALDTGRKPAELLAFVGVGPGQKVADLGAGFGYTTELLARMVGESGTVYGQNSKFILGFAEQGWSERLTKPVMKHVVRLDREFDEPLPADLKDLDLVTLVLFYHDTVWLKTARERMNHNVFAALKSGGHYAIVDHSAKAGEGVTVAQTLHRIEEAVVKSEVTKAGFVLEAEADFLREPGDTRDWNASPKQAAERRGHSDRFALRFKKP